MLTPIETLEKALEDAADQRLLAAAKSDGCENCRYRNKEQLDAFDSIRIIDLGMIALEQALEVLRGSESK